MMNKIHRLNPFLAAVQKNISSLSRNNTALLSKRNYATNIDIGDKDDDTEKEQQMKTMRKLARSTRTESGIRLYYEYGLGLGEDSIEYGNLLLGKFVDVKTQYPNVTFEETDEKFHKFLNDFYNRLYVDNDFKAGAKDALGYSEDQVNLVFSKPSEWPTLTKQPEIPISHDDYEIDFDNLESSYFNLKGDTQYLGDLKRNYRKIRTLLVEAKNRTESESEIREPNWEKIEKEFGKNTAHQMKKTFDETVQTIPSNPNLDAAFDRFYTPMTDAVKDSMIEFMEKYTPYKEKAIAESKLLKKDEYGVPVDDFESLAWIDKNKPHLRDQAFEDIEIDKHDVDYTQEMKALKLNNDVLAQRSTEVQLRIRINQIVEATIEDLTISQSVTEEDRLFNQMYLDVVKISRTNKQLESQLQQLRSEMEEDTHVEGTTTKKEESVKTEELKSIEHVLLSSDDSSEPDFPGVPEDHKAAHMRRVEDQMAKPEYRSLDQLEQELREKIKEMKTAAKQASAMQSQE